MVITYGDGTNSYWPIYMVLAGGQVPYEITLYDTQEVADTVVRQEALG